jgi:hypothetical protein
MQNFPHVHFTDQTLTIVTNRDRFRSAGFPLANSSLRDICRPDSYKKIAHRKM